MKRAFLVLGPERSGTRLTTKILMAGGCIGDDGHDQLWDKTRPTDDLIVWRRSIPHRSHRLDMQSVVDWLRGYQIHAVIPVRDHGCIENSQMRELGRVIDPHVSYMTIFEQLAEFSTPFTLVSFESLVLDPDGVQKGLWESLRLNGGSTVPVYDANLKYKI